MEAGSRRLAHRETSVTPSGSPPLGGRLRPCWQPENTQRCTGTVRNVSSTVSVVIRRETGPAMSTSNGRATLLPAKSSSSVPILREYSPAFHASSGVNHHTVSDSPTAI